MALLDDDLHARRKNREAIQGVPVAQPAAVTSAAAVAAPTKAEYDALRQDVVNLRTTLSALITSEKDAGQIG